MCSLPVFLLYRIVTDFSDFDVPRSVYPVRISAENLMFASSVMPTRFVILLPFFSLYSFFRQISFSQFLKFSFFSYFRIDS